MTQLVMKHLLGLEGVSREQITALLDLAIRMKEVGERPLKKVPSLRGKTVCHLFVEPSTRTKTSFDIAAKRLSADTMSLTASASSLTKGESLLDTALTLQAMGPDILVLRHNAAGAPHFLTRHIKAAVVNAGDGSHEHPTQALLDMMTMRQRLGRVEGLRVAIVGDIAHSRVARSNIFGLVTMGAKVVLSGPATMVPKGIEQLGVEVAPTIEGALEGADVVMMLRIQKERMGSDLFPSDREYFRLFGLTRQRLRLARPNVIVMHPGPINRGVEITPDVADGPESMILEQVTNGVAIRMAVLYVLAHQTAVDTGTQGGSR
ncbi:MAG: aspartate carbamoyltransferase catalytic subunit [Myxococcota bacterium]|jgi:aspartate carbamoyltransferase catalytic subunit